MSGLDHKPGYLSLRHAALWADVSPKTVHRWIAAGLPVYRATEGGKILVKPWDIDQFLQRREVPKADVDAMVSETLKEMGLMAGSQPSGRARQGQPLPC